MKITKLGANTISINLLSLVNCCLVREADGFTLIDTGTAGSAKDILKAAEQNGAPIRRILLTHAHGDHMGSLDTLHTALGHPDVAIGEREAPLLHKDLRLRPNEPRTKLRGFLFPGAKTRPTHTLADGELFGSLRVLNTPGHTPGHISLLDERDGTLFAGDALVAIGGTLNLATHTPWYFPLPKIFSWDRSLVEASAKRLQTVPCHTILCGHGAPTPNGPESLNAALKRADVH